MDPVIRSKGETALVTRRVGARTRVVVLHGSGGGLHSWDAVATELTVTGPDFTALQVRDLERPGAGVPLRLPADDAQVLHDELAAAGVPIVTPPVDGPFGRTFTFTDPRWDRAGSSRRCPIAGTAHSQES